MLYAVEGRRQAVEFRNSCHPGPGRPVAVAPACRGGQQVLERLRHVAADIKQGGKDGNQKHADQRRRVQPDRLVDLGEDVGVVTADEHGDASGRLDIERNVSEQLRNTVGPHGLGDTLTGRMEEWRPVVGYVLTDADRFGMPGDQDPVAIRHAGRGFLTQIPLANSGIEPAYIDACVDDADHSAGMVDDRIADTDHFVA